MSCVQLFTGEGKGELITSMSNWAVGGVLEETWLEASWGAFVFSDKFL